MIQPVLSNKKSNQYISYLYLIKLYPLTIPLLFYYFSRCLEC
ncbi:putative membrane protein [Acinetobacter baumannii 348935]|nr:putative membrane protein [Acinetobacter baumannii 348935]